MTQKLVRFKNGCSGVTRTSGISPRFDGGNGYREERRRAANAA